MIVEGTIQDAHMAVAAGRGWALVTRARALAPPGGTSTVPIEGFEFKVLTYAMWRRSERRPVVRTALDRSEEHTSELQSQSNLVCRLLLEKKKKEHGWTPALDI